MSSPNSADPVDTTTAQDSSSGGVTNSPSVEPTTTSSNSPTHDSTTTSPTQPPSSTTTTEHSTTTTPEPSSTTTTTTSNPPTTPSASPTTTSNSPTSIPPSSAPTTSAPPTQGPPSQSTSTLIVPPSTTSHASPTTIPTQIVTTDSAGRSVTASATVVLSTDANGNVITVTQYVPTTHAPGTESSHGASNFFDNTGAVAGVFVVIGLVVTAIIVTFTFIMLRRRRRQRLDRDVAAAAAAAAAASHSRFDEEDDQPSMTQYGGYYTATNSGHSVDQQQANLHHGYDYEDPSGGYDPYASHLVDVPPIGDRSSTATAPGLAGFGATAAQTNYYNGHPQQSRDVDYSQGDYGHTYGDPQYDVAHQYAAPMQGLAPVAEMSAEGHSDHQHQQQNYYNSYAYNDDPYEGYAAPGGALPRQDSSGSVGSHGAHHGGRDLTVTNA